MKRREPSPWWPESRWGSALATVYIMLWFVGGWAYATVYSDETGLAGDPWYQGAFAAFLMYGVLVFVRRIALLIRDYWMRH